MNKKENYEPKSKKEAIKDLVATLKKGGLKGHALIHEKHLPLDEKKDKKEN